MTVPPKLTEPDRSLLIKCVGPVDIGKLSLTQAQVEKFWSTDRRRLVNCQYLQSALIDFVNEQNRLLKETK